MSIYFKSFPVVHKFWSGTKSVKPQANHFQRISSRTVDILVSKDGTVLFEKGAPVPRAGDENYDAQSSIDNTCGYESCNIRLFTWKQDDAL